jgi:hypothetical protein
MVDGVPVFQIGPKATKVRKGLMGGYCYRRMQVSGERFTDKPDKNEFSHPVEAFEYICTRMFGHSILTQEVERDEVLEEFFGIEVDNDSQTHSSNSLTGY